MGGVLRAVSAALDPRRLRMWELGLGLVALLAGLLIVRLPLLDALLLVFLASVALGSLVEPLVGVGAALLLGPLRAWLAAELPAVPDQIGQGLFVLAVAAWLARGAARREVRVPFPPLSLPLLAFLAAGLLSLWSPVDAWAGFTEWAKWVQLLLAFFVAYDRFRDLPRQRGAAVGVVLLVGVGVVQAGVGLWQFGLRGDGPAHFAIDDRFYRAYGTFEQPNPFGGFLGMTAALLVGWLLVAAWDAARRRRIPRGVFWGGAGSAALLGGGLLASWSRGAWMGFGAALLVMAAALPRRGAWGLVLVFVAVGAGLGLLSAGLLPAPIAVRLTGFLEYARFEDVRGVAINDANYAVIERMAHWQAALEMWRANFWLGVGLGGYEPAYAAYRLVNWPFALGHAHNFYLTLLAEVGLVGFAAYLVFLGALLGRLGWASRRLTGGARGLALGLLGAWTHFAVHDLVDNLLVNNVHLHAGVLLALSAWAVLEARVGKRWRGRRRGAALRAGEE